MAPRVGTTAARGVATEHRTGAVHSAACTRARLGAIRKLTRGDVRETPKGPVIAAKMARKGRPPARLPPDGRGPAGPGGSRIPAVSKILGQASVQTTAPYYAHLDAEAGRENLAVL